jgi:predicted AAA+ superfamily ATPase
MQLDEAMTSMAQPPTPPVLPPAIQATLQDNNPWWRGERLFGLPKLRRWAFQPVLSGVKQGLTPATVLRGPRQVGKTTLLNQVIETLLDEGVAPKRIFRVQFDELPTLRGVTESILELTRWYAATVLKKSLHQAAHDGEQAYLFFDEVQNLPEWAPQLKHLVDLQPVRVLVTGSSALRIEAGKDSLAGRISTIEMGPLLLREIAQLRGFGTLRALLPAHGLAPLKQPQFWRDVRASGEQHGELRQRAFAAFAERGGYPVAQIRVDQPWESIADLLNETVIRRVVRHDLYTGPQGRRRDLVLLEEVFRLACRYIGQAPSPTLYLNELRQVLHTNIGWQRVLAYLRLLDSTLLLQLIEPLELRLKRQRGAAKLCLCDHALRAAWLQEVVPLTPEGLARSPHLTDLAESVTGYFFRSLTGLDVAHFPARGAEPEVDFVLTVGVQRIPVEVKYRRHIDSRDLAGLRAFVEKPHYNAPFGILVTLTEETASDDPRIVSLPLSTLLLMR